MGRVFGFCLLFGVGALVGLIAFFTVKSIVKNYTEYKMICNFFRCFYDVRPFAALMIAPLFFVAVRDSLRRIAGPKIGGHTGLRMMNWITAHPVILGIAASLLINPDIHDSFSRAPV